MHPTENAPTATDRSGSDRHVLLDLADDDTVVYDVEHPERWLQSDTTSAGIA